VAGAVSGVQQKRTLAHAPFAVDQTALFGPCGATFQIDFTYHNRKSLVDAVGLEPTVAFATVEFGGTHWTRTSNPPINFGSSDLHT
jgi:hypothetical protein